MGMSIVFHSRPKKHNNSVFFEQFFKFFFPSFELVCFICEQKSNKLTDITLIEIKFVGDGFSDCFAYDYIFLKQSLKNFLSSDMAYVKYFTHRIGIIKSGIIFEQKQDCFSFIFR